MICWRMLCRHDHLNPPCNKEINGLRSVVERAISHVKTWRIFHTDYRRPLRTFDQAFRTTRALYFFSTTF